MSSELTALTATEAAARIASGDLLSENLVQACLKQIDALEPQVQAWAFLDRDYALEQAKAADEARRQGRGVGPLHGVPVGIKDIIDTADMPTENGSPVFKGRVPDQDAACITALRRAGAVVMGKTVSTELATLTPSRTRNPHNLEHTPGGSSAGSAAAVAAGMVPLAIGTQTGGSVIRPSSFCGVFGFKPTFGVIPRSGVLEQSASLDTVGVHARSVEDLALLADALQAHDARDPASLTGSRPRLRETAMEDFPLPPMFAYVKSHAWGAADPRLHEAFAELVSHLGQQVEEISLDNTMESGVAAARTVQSVEIALNYGPLLDRAPDQISPGLTKRIEEGRRIPATDYVAALNARARFHFIVEELFINHGTILTPAAPGPAPAGLGSTGNPVFNAFWTYLGVPCVTLPLLEADGLPIGVQIVGPPGDDGRLLRTARWLARNLETAE